MRWTELFTLLIVIISFSLVGFADQAFALDQIRLTTGQVVFGDILADSPEHIDIRMENGIAKRIPHSAISKIDRDVPSPSVDTGPHEPIGFVSLHVGGIFVNSNADSNRILLDYGMRLGFLVGDLFDRKLALALNYDQASITETVFDGVFHTEGYNDWTLQILFMPKNGNGFYFGPNIGVMSRSDQIDSVDTGAGGNNYEAGINAGYTFGITKAFSAGPDFRYDHVFGPTYVNTIRLTLDVAFHF